MPFKNFRMWRSRLPHWRADEVTYFVRFKHRRPLTEAERCLLLQTFLRSGSRKLDIDAACVMQEETSLVFRAQQTGKGTPYEISKVVEPVKRKVGAKIIDNTGERWSPFWEESFDRIIRDESEYEEKMAEIEEAAFAESASQDDSDCGWLYLREA